MFMDHVAILSKQHNLLELILSDKKTIESRWYKHKRDPWNKININDRIFFKNSGELVVVYAEVENVLQFEGLSQQRLKEIYTKYGSRICGTNDFDTNKLVLNKFSEKKNYCILIFLKEVKSISPFDINKAGFGNASAWLCVEDIENIKIC